MVQLIRLIVQQPFVFFQQLVISLLYALPFVFGLLLETAGASLKLALEALKFALSKIPELADETSFKWGRRAILEGFPYLWQPQLQKAYYWLAVLSVIGSWLLLQFFTAFLLSLLF